MKYQHRCTKCKTLYVSSQRYAASCPQCPYSASEFVADVAVAAIEAYVATAALDVATDVIGGLFSVFD